MSRVESRRASRLRPWAAAGGAVGGVLWVIKSSAILVANTQPDYAFEIAPFFFGVAAIGLVLNWEEAQPWPGRRPRVFGLLGTAAGALAALTYVAGAPEEIFGPALMVSTLIIIGLLLYTGRTIRRERSLGQWSIVPWVLGWLFVGAIPVGGVLESVDERLLEIPLLAIGLGWLALSMSVVRIPAVSPH